MKLDQRKMSLIMMSGFLFAELSFANSDSIICFPSVLRSLETEEAFTNQDLYASEYSKCFENLSSNLKSPESQAIRAVTTGLSSKNISLFGYKWKIERPQIYKSVRGVTVKGTLYHVGKIQRMDKIEYQFTYSGQGSSVAKQSIKIIPGSSEKNPFTYLENSGNTKKLAWVVDLGLKSIGLSNIFINREVIEDLSRSVLKDEGEQETTWQEHSSEIARALSDRSYLWHLYLLKKANNVKKNNLHIR